MVAILSALLFLPVLSFAAPVALPVPPNIPSPTTAAAELNALRVAAWGSQTGYSRDLFPHWINQGNNCNTREVVLKRDGRNVVQDSSCAAVSGSWYSPFDGATWTSASDVDIDHMVPLSNAWKVRVVLKTLLSFSLHLKAQCLKHNPENNAEPFQSGAASWSTSRRQAFANDLTYPELIAVTDNVNQAKSDSGPEAWKPPLSE